MPQLILENVDVEYPFLGVEGRSLRSAILRTGITRNLQVGISDRVSAAALQDISLTLKGGDRMALIGPNGAGKTTLLKTLAGVYQPARGRMQVDGQVRALLTPTLGLDPEANGWQNITLMGVYLGIPPRIMRQHAEEIADWTELGAYMDAPLKTYSAGMMTRLSFATGTCLPAEILLLDEWLSAGDASFQLKAYARMQQFVEKASILVLASHSLDLLQSWCSRALLLIEGRMAESGEFGAVLETYKSVIKPPSAW